MGRVSRILTGFFAEDDGKSGLIEKADGTVWYRKPDGSEAEVGSGGSQPALAGFQAYLSGPTSFAGLTHFPFDVLGWDTDGYWDAPSFAGAVPAGKAGLYEVSTYLYVTDDSNLTGMSAILNSGSLDALFESGFDIQVVRSQDQGGHNGWYAAGSFQSIYDVGDGILLDLGWFPFTVASITLNEGSYLAARYLGPNPT